MRLPLRCPEYGTSFLLPDTCLARKQKAQLSKGWKQGTLGRNYEPTVNLEPCLVCKGPIPAALYVPKRAKPELGVPEQASKHKNVLRAQERYPGRCCKCGKPTNSKDGYCFDCRAKQTVEIPCARPGCTKIRKVSREYAGRPENKLTWCAVCSHEGKYRKLRRKIKMGEIKGRVRP